MDNEDKDILEGSNNNNPPGNAELLVNNHINNSIALTVSSPLVESDKNDNDDGTSSTALSLTANESNATTAQQNPWQVDTQGGEGIDVSVVRLLPFQN
jgi:hypothetical protein